MTQPATLFGRRAVWRGSARATELGRLRVGDLTIRVVRWDLRDVTLESLDLGGEGHVIGYAVEGPDGLHRTLYQQESSFYQEEGSPPLTYLQTTLPHGDGFTAPKWHKRDRAWPVEGASVFEFIGQGYFDTSVVYVFRHPGGYRLAIFSDEVDRQDAEEHYAEEERRWKRRRTLK